MKEMDRLVEIMERLRGPGGCPWDARQDHRSMIPGLVEEIYELADAIENAGSAEMLEELGDVLLHVVFHSIIAAEDRAFTIRDVATYLADKLVYRHPHVFGDKQVQDADEVVTNWDKLKQKEAGKRERESILSGIPKSLPALLYAFKIQSATSRVGFDWENPAGVVEKIKEEVGELENAVSEGVAENIEDEIGDMFFSVVNLARMLKVDPEAALRRSNRKFAKRFSVIEQAAREREIAVSDMSMEEMEAIWQRTKTK